jgi:acyl-CoA synthetase (AMP-forming)/AMP-acid ligase II
MGVGGQDRIAYLDKNTREYFTYVHASTKLNAVTVAVNWCLAPPEMEYILNHSESKVLLIGEEFLGQLAQINLGSMQVVVLGNLGDFRFPSYQQWIAGYCQVNRPKLIESVHEYLQTPPVLTRGLQRPSGNPISLIRPL